MNKLVQIAQMGKRVFTAQDLAVLWGYSDETKLFELIKYYVRQKQIFAITRGLYTTREYSEADLRGDSDLLLEIANKLVPNSYVSLYTALAKHGLIFQYYDGVYSVAGRSVSRRVKNVNFVYKRIKDEVLLNEKGMENLDGLRIAGPERAVADTWYVYPRVAIDDLTQLDLGKLRKIMKMYKKRDMDRKIENINKEGDVKY